MRVCGRVARHFARRVGHEAGVRGVVARILAALREVAAHMQIEEMVALANQLPTSLERTRASAP